MSAIRRASRSNAEHREMWQLTDGGNVNAVATKTVDGKVVVRLIADHRGTRYHRYNEEFKMIDAGLVPSIKSGMEKFDAVND